MWTTIGDRSFCSLHKTNNERGVPCAQCIADPSVRLDVDDVRQMNPGNSTNFYESKLINIFDKCIAVGDQLIEGTRSTVSERSEPAALAAKFYEVAARCIGRCIDVAAKREERAEIDELKRTIREMRGAH